MRLEEHFADFHETEDGMPFMWMLGRIVLDFNYAEHQMKALLWRYIGTNLELGHSVTAQLGSSSVAAVLLESVAKAEEAKEVLAITEFAARAFDVCRENRNIVAHSLRVDATEEAATLWTRASRKVGSQQSVSLISLSDLDNVSHDIAKTASLLFALGLRRHVFNRDGEDIADLPAKFKMPVRLKSRHINLKEEFLAITQKV